MTAWSYATLLAAWVLLVFSPSAQAQMSISDAIPEGFEALSDAQTLVVNVRFNERLVGSTLVTADPETLTFEEPEAVVGLLTGLKKPKEVIELLRETLPTNGHLVCFGKGDPEGCGQIEADPIAVIYDSGLLILDIFLASSLQTTQSTEGARYLAPPDERNSSILSLSALLSNTSDGISIADLTARTLSSYGSGSIYAEARYDTRSEISRLTEARVTHLYRDHAVSAGTFTFETGVTLANLPIIGASFESSLLTRVDLDDAFSSELVVHLPRRAQVLMVVDDRPYISESYAAGNQAINTRSLPSGTYEVEIRILDPVAGVRSEFRLFTKSTSIPPRGETVYGLTFGKPAAFEESDAIPKFEDISVGGLNVARRITDHSSWRIGLMGLNNISLVESQFLFLGKVTSFHASFGAGSNELRSGQLRFAYSNPIMTLGLNAGWLRSNYERGIDPALDDIIPDEFTQYGASWSRAFGKFSLNARYSHRESGNTPETRKSLREISATARRMIYRSKTLRTNLDLSYLRDAEGETFGIGIVITVDEPRTGSEVGLDVDRNTLDANRAIAHLSHNVRSHIDNPIHWDAHIRAEAEEHSEAIGVEAEIEHKNYSINFNSDWNSIDADESKRNSALIVSTHLGVDNRGYAVGGTDIGQSGVILQIKGEQRDAKFDLYIDEIRSGTGIVGETRFIGLQPYREYTIKLISQSALTSTLSQDTFTFTVYPGAVYRIVADVLVKVLLIATIVDENDEVVRNGFVPRDPNPVLVDSEGFFQAEVSPGDVLTVVRTGMPDCTFSIPQAAVDEEMLILDAPLVCK